MPDKALSRLATSCAIFDDGAGSSRLGRGGSSCCASAGFSAGAGVLDFGVGVRGPREVEVRLRLPRLRKTASVLALLLLTDTT